MSTENVYDAHIKATLPGMHRALLEIVGMINQPERDDVLLRLAGLSLERALFPLLVLVDWFGPIGVVDLAGRIARDYTTVSRQVARLEEIGLVTRRAGAADRRVREAVITPKGKIAAQAVDAARERMALAVFRDWSGKDLDDLARLLRMLADGMAQAPRRVD
jgi:DNA-binding MarR family transcriptional regulator